MPKNRMIRTETWTDEKFVSLDPLARLLFIGMWNYACDNGHLDDSALQLKMRVLPADNTDVAALVDQIVASGMVTRHDGYLKVVNLSEKQPLDLRYLQFCDHCDEDPEAHYAREDKPTGKGKTREARTSGTRAAREQPASGRSRGDVGGDGDVGGKARARRSPERPIPDDWKPTTGHQEYADANGLDLSTEAFKFRNHAVANDRRQRDWDASFRMWLAKATEFAAERPRPRQHRPDLPEAWQ